MLDIIISEVNTNNNQNKLIILEGGYVTTPDFINTTVSQTKNYLRNLARSIKQGNKAESHASAKLNGVQVSSSVEHIVVKNDMTKKNPIISDY